MKFKKMLTLAAIGLSGFGLVACGNQSAASKQSASGTIEVISRENGSGTRGAKKTVIKKLTTLPKQL